MNLVVTARARAQVAALPAIAARAVDKTISLLQQLPRIGVPLSISDDDQSETFTKLVVVHRRARWTLRIVYRIQANDVIIEYVDPSWLRRSSFESR